jgi:c-di-GMP-binding flagellar brake protein YcgR
MTHDTRPAGSARAQVAVRVLDLSIGGGLLVVPTALEVGAIHDFAIDLGGAALWAQCEIRHCRKADRGPGYHVGVQFVGIDPQDERRLRAYLSRA